MDETLRELIMDRVDAQRIQRAAVAAGMQTMVEHGLSKALIGETTIEEILRVTAGG